MTSFAGWLLGCCILLALAACAPGRGGRADGDHSAALDRAPLATATPVATAAVYPTLTPHVYCADVPQSFLVVGERGRVTLNDDGRWLNLRAGPGTDNDVIAQLAPLQEFLVLDGARCADLTPGFRLIFAGRWGGSPRVMTGSIMRSRG